MSRIRRVLKDALTWFENSEELATREGHQHSSNLNVAILEAEFLKDELFLLPIFWRVPQPIAGGDISLRSLHCTVGMRLQNHF